MEDQKKLFPFSKIGLIVLLLCQVSLAEEFKIAANDSAANDWFGTIIAAEGDLVVVGSPRNNSETGAAYIFSRSGSSWSQEQKLTASDGAEGDWFGVSVDISDSSIIVGSILDNSGAGSAYIFTHNGTNWSQQQKITASDGEAGDRFGESVSINNDLAIVGAYLDSLPNYDDAGSAYIFSRSGSVWTQQVKIAAVDTGTGDQFGTSVSISGDFAAVGAPENHIPGLGFPAGAAYVYWRNQGGNDTWGFQDTLFPNNSGTSYFARSVAIDGNYIVSGAWGHSDLITPPFPGDIGAAYVFYRNGSEWELQQRLIASDFAEDDRLGWSVDIDGKYIVAGAPLADHSTLNNPGAVYSFRRRGSTWTQTSKQTASDAADGDFFGYAVAVSGNYSAFGAREADLTALSDAGVAYIYESLADLALPVQLSQITVRPEYSKAIITWKTQSELNNLGFILFRALFKDGDYQQISSYMDNTNLVGLINSSSGKLYSYVDDHLENNQTYWYKLADVGINSYTEHKPVMVRLPQRIKSVVLYNAYPNPFNPSTTIKFDVPENVISLGRISLKIYDITGKLVKTLFEGSLEAGSYSQIWNGESDQFIPAASGVYFVYLSAGEFHKTQRLLLLR